MIENDIKTSEEWKAVIALLGQIAFSMERSASAAEATHTLYKKANNQTGTAMQAREERERESAARDREQHEMNKQRHEAFMQTEKARLKREEEWAARMAASAPAVQEASTIIHPQ